MNKKTLDLRKLLKFISLGILLAGLFFLLEAFYGTDDFILVCALGFIIGMLSCSISLLADFFLGWKKVSDARRRIKLMFLLPYALLLFFFFLLVLIFLGDMKKEFLHTALLLLGVLSVGAIPVSLVVLYLIWDAKDLEDNQEGFETNIFNSIFTNLTGMSAERDKDSEKYKKYHAIYVASIIIFVILFFLFRFRMS